MALQQWQTAVIANPEDLHLLEVGLQALRPIVDSRWNARNYPEYTTSILPELTGMTTLITDLTGRDFLTVTMEPSDLEFQLVYGTMHKVWRMLREYTQGQNPAVCDPARAIEIQDLLASVTAEPTLVDPEVPDP